MPKVVIGTNGHGNGSESGLGGSTILEGLLALLLSDRLGIDVSAASAPPSAAAQKVREELSAKLQS